MRAPRFRNRDGTPIDPVPLLVVVLTAFLITYAGGPLYLGALGASLLEALSVLTLLFLAVVAAAYHRLVRTADPAGTRAREIPAGRRLSWLLYAVAIGIALVVFLLLPFLLAA